MTDDLALIIDPDAEWPETQTSGENNDEYPDHCSQ